MTLSLDLAVVGHDVVRTPTLKLGAILTGKDLGRVELNVVRDNRTPVSRRELRAMKPNFCDPTIHSIVIDFSLSW